MRSPLLVLTTEEQRSTLTTTESTTPLALPANRLASGREDARERRQARARARRMQCLASETADEQEIRLCRRREGERNRRVSESEEARERRLARDRARRRQRRATETAQEQETRLTRRRAQPVIGHGMQPEHHRQGRHASISRGLLCKK